MLKLRVIPCLDVKDGRVVKGVNFVSLRDAGDPVEQAAVYDAAGADELTFLDITASHENRDTILDVVSRTAARVFLPLTVGGGIRSTEDMRRLLLAGTDKCSVNSAAVARPDLVREAALKFGSQCVVVAVDAKQTAPGTWEVFTHGGRRNDRDRRDRVVPPSRFAGGGGDFADQHGPRRHRPAASTSTCCARSVRRGAGARRRLGRASARSTISPRAREAGATGTAGRQRVPFRHVHDRAGEAETRRRRAAGAPAARGGLSMAKVAKRKAPGGLAFKDRLAAKGKGDKAGKLRRALAVTVPEATGAVVLDRLWSVVVSRRDADPAVSHSARLLSRGPAKVAQKFGEEAVECLIEAVRGDRDALIGESADVLYHLLVLWVSAGVAPEEVWAELTRREGVSGIAEKASRSQASRVARALRTTKIP